MQKNKKEVPSKKILETFDLKSAKEKQTDVNYLPI